MDLARAAELGAWTSTVLFLALAALSFRVHRRQHDAASLWLVAAFGGLAAGLLLSRTGLVARVPVLQIVVILAILAFPYLLDQFTSSFTSAGRLRRWLPAAAIAVIAVVGVVVTPIPQEDRSTLEVAWLVAFLGAFVVMSLAVAFRMWRAGSGQPTIARRRMRTLAIAAVLLSLALLVAAGGGSGTARLVGNVMAVVSTLLFWFAFRPPALLRASWRASEEDELYRAALRLMATTSDEEVVDILLPHVTRVVGGRGATISSADGAELGSYGEVGAGEPLGISLSRTELCVWVSPYTPFFGEDESRLILRLGLLADLALDRADLLRREQLARTEVQALNAELEAFVYSASHDLKTPLLTILGFVDILVEERDARTSTEGEHYLARIRANARYMQELIGDLLELSRIGRVETEAQPVDLDRVLAEVSEGVRAGHPDVDVAAAGDLPVLRINPARARQLLANLVENAARYGGRPDVHVTVSADVHGDVCELRVVDDGVGVPSEHHDRVFGVFERLSEAEGGTGIGLAICRKIVQELDGDIAFVDRPVGAEVAIRLPRELVVTGEPDHRAPD